MSDSRRSSGKGVSRQRRAEKLIDRWLCKYRVHDESLLRMLNSGGQHTIDSRKLRIETELRRERSGRNVLGMWQLIPETERGSEDNSRLHLRYSTEEDEAVHENHSRSLLDDHK